MTDYFEDIGMIGEGERLRFAYLIGFTFSLLCTFGAYLLVTQHLFAGAWAVAILLAFAFLQFIMQLMFFLHLDRHLSSRIRIVTLLCAITVVAIVILGSIWIMNNLNTRMMSPQSMEEYMARQPGI